MLIVVTLLWGLSFPWMKEMQDAASDCPGGKVLASLTLITVRMPLAVLLLGLWHPGLFRRSTRRERCAGLFLGMTFFGGFALQVWGLAYTTPALSAFFTSLGSAWAPLIAWLFLRQRIALLPLLGLCVAIIGTTTLVEGGWRFGRGESLTIVASFLFAGQILFLDHVGKSVRSEYMSPTFFGMTTALAVGAAAVAALTGPGLSAWLEWTARFLIQPRVLGTLALLVVFSTVLSFHWMNVYQPRVAASQAALIYLLEPVFGSIFSVWSGHDQITNHLMLGGGLILAGNVLAETRGWTKRKRPQ
jgi:drug/metabolite transporter (DMT)-like permease